MKSKVTVIIPAYNVENYIKQCLDSIINQTYKNIDIIIINDGSTDNTLKIINQYAKKYKFIKLIDIENNGQGYARNLALKQATGEYIMFVDSDDYLELNTIELTIEKIVSEKSDFVDFGYRYYQDKGKSLVLQKEYSFSEEKQLKGKECLELFNIPNYFVVNKLYDRKFLINNKIFFGEHYIYEDILFWVRCVLKATKVSIMDTKLYNVRSNMTSTTKSNIQTDRHATSFIKVYDESIILFDDSFSPEKKYFLNYMLKKFLNYYNFRTPKKYKESFFDSVYSRISQYDLYTFNTQGIYFKLGKKFKLFNNKRKFKFFVDNYKNYRNLANLAKKIKSNFKRKKVIILEKNT